MRITSTAQQSNAHKSEFMMLSFQEYQAEFTAHIRNPQAHKKPARAPDSRMAVYREIVFNNIFASASACFPVCQQVLGKRAWRKLVRAFFAQHCANTPLFREIPQQFLQFLNTQNAPDYVKQLAYYEWVELAVSMLPNTSPNLSTPTDLLKQKPVLAPHMLLEYDYAVHKISKKFRPEKPEKAYLLVFRTAEFKVKFVELNPMTYILLNVLAQHDLTGEQALTQLAAEMQHPKPQAIIEFGLSILQDLMQQNAILGGQAI